MFSNAVRLGADKGSGTVSRIAVMSAWQPPTRNSPAFTSTKTTTVVGGLPIVMPPWTCRLMDRPPSSCLLLKNTLLLSMSLYGPLYQNERSSKASAASETRFADQLLL